jgi:hypothetical protein
MLKQRFERNRDKLFTFLRYDDVPWNNNNAEHAIKAFARLRDVIAGSSAKKGVEEYLTLLSVSETLQKPRCRFPSIRGNGYRYVRLETPRKRRVRRAASAFRYQIRLDSNEKRFAMSFAAVCQN